MKASLSYDSLNAVRFYSPAYLIGQRTIFEGLSVVRLFKCSQVLQSSDRYEGSADPPVWGSKELGLPLPEQTSHSFEGLNTATAKLL